jgi:hypothetical protein
MIEESKVEIEKINENLNEQVKYVEYIKEIIEDMI